ncbi:GntR family transcriptional regulator (plasmid) [Streptomyces sp. NBC_01298]|uniref:GntR family transcriptional regulator n=1 Tax=Streptomyces sp. NBC_01298 TaxID=2903817 RepID=UPI002E166304|nr:GntR family transcriptional regulator [Streptomyces sp. NBC_01298]WSK26340.1 GntR family transcriptional regulator [Streptomyces sp. NBC_01298]
MPELRRADAPYAQVAQYYRDQVHGRQLLPGDFVPSVRDIAAQWGISKATAEKALAVLRSEGLLIAVPGVGTKVATTLPTVQLGGERVRRMLTTGRATRPGETSSLISSELAPADDAAAEFLGIEPGAPALRRRRRFSNEDGVVLAVSTSWLRAEVAQHIPALLETAPIPGGTIGAVRDVLGRQPGAEQTALLARLASADEAELLGLDLPEAVMVTETRISDEDGEPIELGQDVIAPNQKYVTGTDLSLL